MFKLISRFVWRNCCDFPIKIRKNLSLVSYLFTSSHHNIWFNQRGSVSNSSKSTLEKSQQKFSCFLSFKHYIHIEILIRFARDSNAHFPLSCYYIGLTGVLLDLYFLIVLLFTASNFRVEFTSTLLGHVVHPRSNNSYHSRAQQIKYIISQQLITLKRGVSNSK